MLTEEEVHRLTSVLSALGNPTRIKIVMFVAATKRPLHIKAISQMLRKDYATVYLDRNDAITKIEKDLVLCEKCGAIVGTPDHIRWVADRLGPLAYSNPTLLLSTMRDSHMLGEVPDRQGDLDAGRHDVVRVLCPTCRREIQLKA